MTRLDEAPVAVAIADEHETALRYAAAEALRGRRPLRVMHVVPPLLGLAGPGPEAALITFEAAEIIAEQLLQAQYQRAIELVDGRVPVQKVLLRGPHVDMLLERCADVDHLVVQHRDARRLGRLATGSTAAALAARSAVPVVSVPEHWPGRRPAPHVTVALGDRDVEGAEVPLLRLAFAQAVAQQASLTVLHAWFFPDDYGVTEVAHPTLRDWQSVAHQDVEDRVSTWRARHPSVDVRVQVPHVRPAEALLRASAHSDLLVVARRRSHGLVHLGAVVRTVLRASTCPVMVIPPTREAPDAPSMRTPSRPEVRVP